MTTLFDPQKPRPVTAELHVTPAEIGLLFPQPAGPGEPPSDAAEVVLAFLRRVRHHLGQDVARTCARQVVGIVIVPHRPRRADRVRLLN